MKITKQTRIKSLLAEHPETAEILMSYGLQCVNCHFSEFDVLGDAADIHGLSDEDMEMMIRDVNKIIKDQAAVNKLK